MYQVLNGLYQLKIMSVMIEGGAKLIQSFIDEGMWDEARVITNTTLLAAEGVNAPTLQDGTLARTETLLNDTIAHYYHN